MDSTKGSPLLSVPTDHWSPTARAKFNNAESPRPPSVILSHASSSSASSSSSPQRTYSSPDQHEPELLPSPPPPPPSRFLFWPDPIPAPPESQVRKGKRQFAYGWTCNTTALVAGVLLADERVDAERQLKRVSEHFKLKRATFGLRIIASCSNRLDEGRQSEKAGKGKGKAKECATVDDHADGFPSWLHLRIDDDSPYPTIQQPTTQHQHTNPPLPITIILYTPPSRAQLQFFSLTPLQLDLNSFSSRRRTHTRRRSGSISSAAIAAEQKTNKEEKEHAALVEKLKRSAQLDFTSPTQGQSLAGGVTNLEQVVDWMNLGPELSAFFSPPSPRPSLRRLPFSPTLARVGRLLTHPARLFRVIGRAILLVTNYELPGLGGTALKDVSATMQQVDTRVSQTLAWPSQYSLIKATLDRAGEGPSGSSIAGRGEEPAAALALGRAHYIQFYNTMWLIANDIITGSAFTSFVCENSDYLGRKLGELVKVYALTSLRELLLWLNDWPGGVKLNFELATIFCDAFLWATGLWEQLVLNRLIPHLPLIVYCLGLSGLVGTTMFFSLASDLMALLTLHIFCFYLMATSLFRWHLSLLGALFNIFRGKKFNVLRNRVEPAVYEVDQLLLGTILFTLAAFLFPTVLVYYLAFAASRLTIVVLHAAMETALSFMNHFPLFAVMLRLKDSARLPGGLQFEVEPECYATPPHAEGEGEVGGGQGGLRLRLTNHPIHLAGIFFQHLQLSRRLASHYSPIYLLGRLASGRVISPIPRVRLRLDTHQIDSEHR